MSPADAIFFFRQISSSRPLLVACDSRRVTRELRPGTLGPRASGVDPFVGGGNNEPITDGCGKPITDGGELLNPRQRRRAHQRRRESHWQRQEQRVFGWHRRLCLGRADRSFKNDDLEELKPQGVCGSEEYKWQGALVLLQTDDIRGFDFAGNFRWNAVWFHDFYPKIRGCGAEMEFMYLYNALIKKGN